LKPGEWWASHGEWCKINGEWVESLGAVRWYPHNGEWVKADLLKAELNGLLHVKLN
jgi:hypothetical protein